MADNEPLLKPLLDEWPEVGFVLKAHGVRGDLCVQPFNQQSESLGDAQRIKIGAKVFELLRSKRSQKFFIVSLAGVADRDAAHALKGEPVMMQRQDLDLGEGEFLLSDLIGLVAYDDNDKRLGVVEGVETGVQDRLVVVAEDEEFQVPLVDALVPSIDVENKRIVLNLPEGLPTIKRET